MKRNPNKEQDRQHVEVAVNRRVRRNYEILEKLEVGIALSGTEVKTLRNGRLSLDEAYVTIDEKGFVLVGAHIAEYLAGNQFNHEPTRNRRLLAHKREIHKWQKKIKVKGLTLVPLRLYFFGKWAKLEIALAKGRRLHDKREVVRKSEDRKVRRLR